MANVEQEVWLAIQLVYDAIGELRADHPGNELLQFADTFDQAKPPEEFCKRFGGARIPDCFRKMGYAVAVMYNNYCNDLLEALGRPPRLFGR